MRRLRTGPEGLVSAGMFCRKCWSLPPYARRRNLRGISNFRGGGSMASGIDDTRYVSATEGGKVRAVAEPFCLRSACNNRSDLLKGTSNFWTHLYRFGS